MRRCRHSAVAARAQGSAGIKAEVVGGTRAALVREVTLARAVAAGACVAGGIMRVGGTTTSAAAVVVVVVGVTAIVMVEEEGAMLAAAVEGVTRIA